MGWPTNKWLWLWTSDWRTYLTTDCWLIDSLSERLTGNTPADVLRASTSCAPWLRFCLRLERRAGGAAAWGAKRTSAWEATADWLTDWLIERWTKGRLANLLNDVYTAGWRTECSLLNEVQQADWLTDFTKYHRLDWLGSFSLVALTTATAERIVTFKRNSCVFQWRCRVFPIRWKCQMNANFPSVDFLRIGRTIRTALKFRKRKKNSSLRVYVLHKTWNKAFSLRSLVGTAKKCWKTCHAHAKLLFCSSNLLLFFRSRCCRRRRC